MIRGLCAILLAVGLAGCYGGVYVESHVHGYGCGHWYYHDIWWEYEHPANCSTCCVHVHGDACGHYYWHDGWWDYPHPWDCAQCHVHGWGCGHYFWHGCWWDYPHDVHCCCH